MVSDLHVLHVVQPTHGGVAAYAADLAAHQVRRGLKVVVACPAGGQLAPEIVAAGAAWLRWEAGRSPGLGVPAESRRLSRSIRELGPDLVHLHSSKAGLAGRFALRGRLPTVFQPHAWSFDAVTGAVERAACAWERRGAAWCDVVLCVSQAERERGRQIGINARWAVVLNGVDLGLYPAADAEARARSRRELALGDGPLVVCVGRLCRQKGQDLLLEAWRLVTAKLPAAELALVGDGPDRAALESGAPAGVRFAGQRRDVVRWLAAADVVAIPSRWEGMSLTMIEAMASARSIVSTDVSGARETVDGDAGTLVGWRPTELAEAIVARLLDPDLCAREGSAGRARAERAHDIVETRRAVGALYEDVLAAREASGAGARGAG
jgi:glycosyltransferase involved in cell wall biosynthesis